MPNWFDHLMNFTKANSVKNSFGQMNLVTDQETGLASVVKPAKKLINNKKTMKKTIKKKATTKTKVIKTAKVVKELTTAPVENCFWVNGGPILRDLRELLWALKEMPNETYFYHANDERNDFGSWIADVLNEVEFAKQLAKSKTRQEAVKTLESYLKKEYNISL